MACKTSAISKLLSTLCFKLKKGNFSFGVLRLWETRWRTPSSLRIKEIFYLNSFTDLWRKVIGINNTQLTCVLNVWLTFVFHQVTCNYFQMMNALASPAPIQFQTLAESSRNYEPGSQFSEYIRLQQANAPQTVFPVYQFEPYNASMYVLSFIAYGDCLPAFFLSLSSSGYSLPRRRF